MSTNELTVIEIIEIDPPQPRQPDPPRKPYLCRHIFVDGHQCGSRSLRGQHFCYYHYAHRTPVLANQRRRHSASGFDLTLLDGLDNHAAIQISISEVLGRIANKSIDPKSAWLLLYGLKIAGHNLRQARPNPEAPVPETIVEDPAHGQLAAPEPGRPVPPGLLDRMCAALKNDPNANLDQLIDLQTSADFPIPKVQTQPLQIETLGPKDRGMEDQ
jgi:hypothetical protein